MPVSDFTYSSYLSMLELIQTNGYIITNYHATPLEQAYCILRHDIDNDVEAALKISKLESDNGVSSTFFVLLSTSFYNIFSKETMVSIDAILEQGHEVGLHFDETKYNGLTDKSFVEAVQEEAFILGKGLGIKIKSVSMHRPSKQTLEANYDFNGLVNSYSHKHFDEFKYISDSRMCWRENAEDVILSHKYDKLHILTHAFWYAENKETTRDKLLKYIRNSVYRNYDNLFANFSNLSEFISRGEVL